MLLGIPDTHYLAVSLIPSKTGISGTVLNILSPKLNLGFDNCLRIDTQMKNAQFDISTALPQLFWLKEFVCTVADSVNDVWRTVYIDIKGTEVNVTKVVTFAMIFFPEEDGESYIHLDNITFYWSDCDSVIPLGLC